MINQIDPQQELFTRLNTDLRALGYDVYDGCLPPENTAYPFIYLGDSRQTDEANKSAVFGNVSQTIHIWHNNPRQRGTVSAMLLAIKTVLRKIDRTANFSWSVRNVSQHILPDNTTKTPLLHGVIEADIFFS